MGEFELFEEQIRDTLQHLCDPEFQPNELLFTLLGVHPADGYGAIQSLILGAINDLEPNTVLPIENRARRAYEILRLRFVLGLTQEETADYLHMSRRSLQRFQVEAIHWLVLHLWEKPWVHGGEGGRPLSESVSDSAESKVDWQAQADLELASLKDSAPGVNADLAEVIAGMEEVIRVLSTCHGVRVERSIVQDGLRVAIHPAAMRQTLIGAIRRLLPIMDESLTLYAVLQDGQIRITLTGPVKADSENCDVDLVDGIIAPPGLSVTVEWDAGSIFLILRVPSAEQYAVVVVEDNEDMVNFYRRCCDGTPFRIKPRTPSSAIVEQIEASSPDAIVLDVMLPGVDGWQILMTLHERPVTREIPVIVCSVVREEELAMTLGAACFLAKPVQPRRLVSALEQVIREGKATSPTSAAMRARSD
jgi:CheY-like chemotaxis protein